jgi:hypothetical protein
LQVLRGMDRLLHLRKAALLIELEERHNPRYLEVFDYLGGLGYEPYFTADGIAVRRLEIGELKNLQSADRFAADAARKFRLGEHKSYVNNIFFFQTHHKAQFRVR